MTLYIRQSEIASFLNCRRQWSLQYLHRLEKNRPESEPRKHLDLGTLVHAAVENYWKLGKDAFTIEGADLRDPAWAEIYRLASAMMSGYRQWVESGELMDHRPLVIEQLYKIPFGTFHGVEVVITFKVDRLEKNLITEENVLVDIKTTQNIVRVPEAHKGQMLRYAALLYLQGITVDRIETEQIRKVLRTGSAKPPFFERASVGHVNEEMIQSTLVQMRRLVGEMVMMRKEWEAGDSSGLVPHFTKDCEWRCDFREPCSAMDDGSDFEHLLSINYRPRPEEYSE